MVLVLEQGGFGGSNASGSDSLYVYADAGGLIGVEKTHCGPSRGICLHIGPPVQGGPGIGSGRVVLRIIRSKELFANGVPGKPVAAYPYWDVPAYSPGFRVRDTITASASGPDSLSAP
jgi:hypothetical protein